MQPKNMVHTDYIRGQNMPIMFWVIYMAYRVGASPKTYERTELELHVTFVTVLVLKAF